MMLTSVSSISTTIESKSERAVENLTAAAPPDKVGLTETDLTTSPRSQQCSYRHGRELEPQPPGHSQLPQKIGQPQRKRRQQLQGVVGVLRQRVQTLAAIIELLVRRRGRRHSDRLRKAMPVRLAIPVNPVLPQASQPVAHAHSEA